MALRAPRDLQLDRAALDPRGPVIPELPRIRAALETGVLSLDKVLELCRFATPETEPALIPWARRVTVAGIRRRADLANRLALEEVKEAERSRYLRYWWEDDGRLGLEGSLPGDQGAVVVQALDRLAGRLPDVAAADDGPESGFASDAQDELEARQADALVALASTAIATDQDSDRATVVHCKK